VPADNAPGGPDELGPVFSTLAAVQDECEAIRSAAERDAAQILERARAQAASIGSTAQVENAAERARTAAQARAQITEENHATAASGHSEAETIRRRAAARTPGLTARAVALVSALRDGAPAGTSPPGGGTRPGGTGAGP
jgi:hypothetical protein